jgi:hypothetical protein
MKSIHFVSLSLLFALGCSRVSPESSHTKEQIDSANNLITQYGLSEMPNYDELLKFPVVETKDAAGNSKLPWTDTYWATVNKNLAARWGFINSADEANLDAYADFKIGAFFKTQIDAVKAEGTDLPVNLSPAEKFDIAYRHIKKMPLKADDSHLAELIALDPRHDAFLAADITQESRLTSKRSLAADYLKVIDASSNAEQGIAAISPLVSEGYSNWINNSLNEGNVFPGEEAGEAMDWSWEGICHGWAPAAVMSDEPKHAVQVIVKDAESDKTKNLMFTEGDIRALLDKSWADARNAEQFFIGRRCEQNLSDPSKGVPSNAQGRGVTGTMNYTDSTGKATSGNFTIVQDYPRKSGNKALYRVILENEWTEKTARYAYLIETNFGRAKTYKLSYSEADAFKEIETSGMNRSSNLHSVTGVQYYGCWDTNPASFHALLVENIGKKNLGIVMDRTQSAQVWNQPVGKAEFTIGELKAVADLKDKDIAHDYRAPGTAFVAEVTTTVHWAAEPAQPRFAYTQDGQDFDAEQITKTTYHYTLEFDANKKLIGGEWGTLSSFKTHENPDFLFGYSSKVEPNLDRASSYLKDGYSAIIKKIHDCSLSDKTDGEIKADLNLNGQILTQTIAFSKCEI